MRFSINLLPKHSGDGGVYREKYSDLKGLEGF